MLNIAFRSRMGLGISVIALITMCALLQGAPSFAKSSTLTATAGKETGSKSEERSAVPAQEESTPSGQLYSCKSATDDNWKLYVNDTYNYEISYPPSAILDASNPQEVHISFKEPFYMSEHSQGIAETGITITIHDNPKHLSAKEWASKIDPDFIEKRQDIDINEVKGYKIKTFEFDRDGYIIYMLKGDRIYEIDFWDPLSMPEFSDKQKKRYDELFRNILNTFRFR